MEHTPDSRVGKRARELSAVIKETTSVLCSKHWQMFPTQEISIPMPEKWQRAGEIVGDGWSIAWRTLDAQYWGVPQRRKRIYLVADFGSERAGQILKARKRARGYCEGRETGEGTANRCSKKHWRKLCQIPKPMGRPNHTPV